MEKKNKEILRKCVFIIALAVFIYSSFQLYKIYRSYSDNAQVYKEVEELAPKFEVDEETKEIKPYVFTIDDYASLREKNSDIKGWIMMTNTKVNYPLVQGIDNDYYLTNNFLKKNNAGGAIFISCDNKDPFNERNTTIHGHYMKDGSMFGNLHKYKTESFAKENNKIYITTENKALVYEIFSVYVEKADTYPYSYNFRNDEEYVEFLTNLKNKSKFEFNNVSLNKDDKIITLSTCSYEEEDYRMLIHAKLVSE